MPADHGPRLDAAWTTSQRPSDILGVADVMRRYGYRDRRAARAVMYAVGAFRIGAGLHVRLEDLVAFEDSQRVRTGRAPQSSRAGQAQAAPPRPLARGWWRAESESQGEA